MARHVYKTDLSVSGLDRLIHSLEEYKQNLYDKTALFVEKLADIGIPVIDARIAQTQGDSDKSHTTDIEVESLLDTTKAKITLSGNDILFIEFPTGIYYNSGKNHPKEAEFGYGIGTYPSDKTPSRGLVPGYWWYTGDDGESHYSVGTECTMPMYNASLEIIRNIERVANEVFGNG